MYVYGKILMEAWEHYTEGTRKGQDIVFEHRRYSCSSISMRGLVFRAAAWIHVVLVKEATMNPGAIFPLTKLLWE